MGRHSPLRTLVVPAGRFDGLSALQMLRGSHDAVDVRSVRGVNDLRTALMDGGWDLILAGYSPDGFDALDALVVLAETSSAPPLIVIGNGIGEEAACACIRAGARDFVRIDRLERLSAVVERELSEADRMRQRPGQTCRVAAALPQTVAEADLAGRLTFVNDNGYRMFGYTREDLDDGLHVVDVIAPEDRERVSMRVRHILETGEAGSGEYRVLRKDGTTFEALISSSSIIRDGRPVGIRSIVVDITDRVEAEEKLRESEERYRTLVENMHEGVWAIDAEGVTTFVNERISEMLGYPVDEIVGRHFWEFHAEEDAAIARRALNDEFGGKPRTVPRRFITASGEERRAMLRPVPLFDERGEFRAAFATVVDVTERTRIEQERRQTLLKFRTLFDQLNDPVFIHDLEGRFVEVNDAACARLGYTRGELLQMDSKELDIAGYAGSVDRKIQHLIEHGEGCFQSAHVTRDGEIVPVEISARVIDYDGRPHVVAIARDIGTRIEAERRFSTIFDAAGTAMCIVAEDGAVTSVNWRFAHLSGYDVDEIEGVMHWTQFVAPNDVERMSAYGSRRRVGAEATPNDYEFDFVDRAGNVRRVLCSVSMIPGTRDAVASLLDVSEREALERQLRQAQKMKAIGDLAGGVAHDFNNILTAILVSVQLLRCEEQLSEGVEEAMDVIESAAKRSASLTRQLLAFGRKQFMEPEEFAVSELVREMKPMLVRLIPECITIETDFAEGVLCAHMDRSQLEHVIMNLVVNARDAMPAGGTLTISVDMVQVRSDEHGPHVLEPGKYLRLGVHDTGVGMDEETRARVFEPFFSTRKGADGNGLGLSTAYGIVRQSGGEITVSSEVGVGTTFRVFLPVAGEGSQEQSRSSAAGANPTAESVR
ncbi:MAG: PAS domain S-box protein [Armatimonadota bacterium]